MQLTRAVLTVALAADTASALPLCPSRDCANTIEANEDSLASAPHEKRSHTSAHQVGIASHAGDADDEFPNSQSRGTAQMESQSDGQDANALLAGSGKQSEQTIHVSETPESRFAGQDSTRSSGYNKLQQNAMENQHDKTANGASHSQNKMGLTLKIRELFKVFGPAQGQMRTQQQHQQEQTSENPVSMRQDKGQAAERTGMDMHDEEHRPRTPQAQGSRYKTWRMHGASSSSDQGQQTSATQDEKARGEMNHHSNNHPNNHHHKQEQEQEQENARPAAQQLQHSAATSPNRQHARSHTDPSGAHSHSPDTEHMMMMDQQQTQHQEQQGLEEHNHPNNHEEETAPQRQQQQQMQPQPQPQSEMARME